MARDTRACRARRYRRISTPCKASGKASCLDLLLDLLQLFLDVLQLVLDFRHPGVRYALTQLLARLLGDLAIVRLDTVELLVLELLEIERDVVTALGKPDQLVELHLDRL